MEKKNGHFLFYLTLLALGICVGNTKYSNFIMCGDGGGDVIVHNSCEI